jgi:site-specific DNA recombinase
LVKYFNSPHEREAYNRDTSRRIRRSKRNRFLNGGPWQCPIYGYIKPAGATSVDDIQKDPAAEPIVERIFAMFEDGASFVEVSDWLNSESVSTGPYCRSEKWTGTILSQFVRNPVLKGIRHWNERTTVRRNSTGLRRSVKASPDDLLTLAVPHLAFVDADRFDRLMRTLKHRNRNYRRRQVDGIDPREGVPRQRTTWPSQHMQCGVCGQTFIFGGHGQAGHIFCRGVPALRAGTARRWF